MSMLGGKRGGGMPMAKMSIASAPAAAAPTSEESVDEQEDAMRSAVSAAPGRRSTIVAGMKIARAKQAERMAKRGATYLGD